LNGIGADYTEILGRGVRRGIETEEAREVEEAERKSMPFDSTPFGYAQGKQDKPFRPPRFQSLLRRMNFPE